MDQLTFGNFVIQIGWAHFVHVYPYFEILLFFQIIIETFNCWLHIPLIRNKCIILCHFPSFTSYFAFKNFTNLKFKFLLVFQQSPFELKPHYLSIMYSAPCFFSSLFWDLFWDLFWYLFWYLSLIFVFDICLCKCSFLKLKNEHLQKYPGLC